MTPLGPDDDPFSLHAQIQRRAVGERFDPWLFFRRGPDWRWISWQEAETAVAGLREALGAVVTPGPVGLPRILDPRMVLAWVATEASGRECLRLGAHYYPSELAREAEGKGCVAWWQLAPPEERSRGLGDLPECLALPYPVDQTGTHAAEEGPSLVELVGGRSTDDEREIAFLACGLPVNAERAFIRWAVEVGAALLLEPEEDSVAAMVHWSRPTVAALLDRHLWSLATGLMPTSERELRKLRRHHCRWRVALVAATGQGPAATSEASQCGRFLESLGVEVQELP